MKQITDLLTSEQRTALARAEGIIIGELEARLVTARKADPGFSLDTRSQLAAFVHTADEPG